MTTEGAAPVSAPKRSGLAFVLGGTVIAGVVSYVITWLVPRQIGFADYAVFAVFWSFLYLLVGTLSGVQQEVARGTRPVESGAAPGPRRSRNFALAAAAAVFVVIVASAVVWVGPVFPREGWGLVLPLALGASSYVLVAVLAGSLYGVSGWRPIAMMIVVDSVLRLVMLSAALIFTHDVVTLAWCAAVPFPLAIIVLWPAIRRQLVGLTQLDVGYGPLVRNAAHTVAAAASTGVMVSGFPLVLGLTARGESREIIGLYILCVTLTRAPLIIVLMSLQSYLVVTLRDDTAVFGARIRRIIALIGGAGAALAVAAWLVGPSVFAFLFPGELVPEGWLLAVLVISSAVVGAMCVTGPALLSRGAHAVYTAGWVIAAIITVVTLLLPLDFTDRTVLALLAGPAAGTLVHTTALIARRMQR